MAVDRGTITSATRTFSDPRRFATYNSLQNIAWSAQRFISLLKPTVLPVGMMMASHNPSVRGYGLDKLSGGDITSAWVKGVVKQEGLFVVRKLRVYRRDTGVLLAEGRSNDGLGKFNISWEGYTGQVYVIVFDDASLAPDYNAEIFDLVTPISG